MTSCTIIISHYESIPFLHACIRQIRKYKHPRIEQRIYIIDQSSGETFEEIEGYFRSHDIYVVRTPALYSGFGIDYYIRNYNIVTDYVCQLHVDAFPIHRNWLYLPIKLIEENNLYFVGQLHFISKSTDTIYPPNNPFFSMSPTFNVAKAETYKEMSEEAGFTRFHNRERAGLEFKNNDWMNWAKDDYNARGSDDDVVAFHWEDKYREHDKLGLEISGFIQPNFGRIIDDLVFHFCSANESRGVDMGDEYNSFTKRISENYSDELINEMIELAKKNKPNGSEILSRNFWNGTTKQSSPPSDELNKRIEELKNVTN